MKNLTPPPLRFIPAGLCLLFALLANRALAAIYFWDPNGLSAPTSGTWDTTSAQWATSSTLTASPVVWNTANLAVFTAGNVDPGTITITVNSAINTAGVFNGGTGGSVGVTTLTISGSGSLRITGAQGFTTERAPLRSPIITLSTLLTVTIWSAMLPVSSIAATGI